MDERNANPNAQSGLPGGAEDEARLIEMMATLFERYPEMLGPLHRALLQQDSATACEGCKHLLELYVDLGHAEGQTLVQRIEACVQANDWPAAAGHLAAMTATMERLQNLFLAEPRKPPHSA
jgi:hypothetical protein